MTSRLRLLGPLVVVGLGLLGSATACEGRARIPATDDEPDDGTKERRPGKIVRFDLSGGAPESMAGGGLFGIPARRTFVGLVRSIQRGADDEDATGYFVEIGAASFGFARSEEIGRALGDLREKTKRPVVCHAHSLSNAGAWLALRGCDRIWVSPAGDVDTVGLAGQAVYFRQALDRLKIQPDFLAMGRYKSFAEMFTRDGPSEAARESMLGMMRSMRATWLDGVKAAAGEKGRSAVEHGPWTPNEAKERGLVHAVGYASDALDDAKERGDGDETSVAFGGEAEVGSGGLVEIVRLLTGADDRSGGRPHVAVLALSGAIAMESGGFFSDEAISATPLRKTIRRLRKDRSVKAVVLRIDSPGGSALASDLLWHELRELAEKKPVIASLGETAASGGYYLAVAADRIVAERTSIIGSIGVVGGKLVVDQALEQIGVTSETFAASPEEGAERRAAYLSLLEPWDDTTRARVRAMMRSVYDVFLDRVAKGRKMSVDEVKKHAEGRIWSGAQGKKRGLVDELGGLGRALAIAREKADLDDDAPVVVEGAQETILDALMLSEGAPASEIARALERYERRRRPALVDALAEPVRPFLGALEPMLHGEPVVTAMPFALVVR